jgi:hypothetical protein
MLLGSLLRGAHHHAPSNHHAPHDHTAHAGETAASQRGPVVDDGHDAGVDSGHCPVCLALSKVWHVVGADTHELPQAVVWGSAARHDELVPSRSGFVYAARAPPGCNGAA